MLESKTMERKYGEWLNFKSNPEELGLIDGERVLCHKVNGWIEYLTFNAYDSCFDDSEGDDFYCNFECVDKILLIPPVY